MINNIVAVLCRLFLGGMMIYGGFGKFSNPSPSPQEVVVKAERFTSPEKEETLQKVLYINGMKQTGFAWEILGVCEILFGLLLIIQYTALAGAILVLPITIHIFFFHVFLEADETGELLMTGVLLLANVFLIVRDMPRWRKLIWIPPLAKTP